MNSRRLSTAQPRPRGSSESPAIARPCVQSQAAAQRTPPLPDSAISELRTRLLETLDFTDVSIKQLVQLRVNVDRYVGECRGRHDFDGAHRGEALGEAVEAELDRQGRILKEAANRQCLWDRPPPPRE
jgi:hypothetical protein